MSSKMLAVAVVILAGVSPHAAFGEDTPPAIPAEGETTITALSIDNPFCRWITGKFDLSHARFSSTLRWGKDGVTVASDDGAFSCALAGKDALAATADCKFAAGGGQFRTQVTCPKAGVKGRRKDGGVHLTIEGCTAIEACGVRANAVVVVKPRPQT
jgi:hypothetical protein